MNLGQKLISFYFILTYLVPAIGNFLFSENIKTVFRTYPLDFNGILTICASYGLYLLLSKLKLFKSMQKFTILEKVMHIINFYLKYRIYFSIFIVLFAAIYFYLGYSIHRYFTSHISYVGNPILFFGMVMHIFVITEFFYFLFLNIGKKLPLKRKVENVLLACSALLYADGSATAIFALFFIAYAFFPNTLMKLLVINKNSKITQHSLRLFLSITLFGLIFLVGWVYGEAVKSTCDRGPYVILTTLMSSLHGKPFIESFSGQNKNSNDNKNNAGLEESKGSLLNILTFNKVNSFLYYVKEYMYYLVDRSSVHYYSFTYTIAMKNTLPAFPILYPLNNLLFRMDYLFFRGLLGFERPKIPSICRLNHLLVSNVEINGKTGSSPGLLAAFNYMFRFPLNIIFCAFYLCFVSLIINYFVYQPDKRMSTLTFLFLYFFFSVLFASPFDYLIVFDNSFIYLVLITTFAVYRKYLLTSEKHETSRIKDIQHIPVVAQSV